MGSMKYQHVHCGLDSHKCIEVVVDMKFVNITPDIFTSTLFIIIHTGLSSYHV